MSRAHIQTGDTRPETGLANPADWLRLALLFIMLGIMAWSVQQARWVTPQPSLLMILALALITGFGLARSRFSNFLAIPLALIIGGVVIFWQGTSLMPEPLFSARLMRLITELHTWWQAALSNEPSPETMHVAILFGYLAWLIGYFSAWFLIRRHNPWVAILLGTPAILISLSNLSDKHYSFFLYYVVAALVLVVVNNLFSNRAWLLGKKAIFSSQGRAYFLVSVICLSSVAVSLSWFTPEVRLYSLESLASTKAPWREKLEDQWRNFFAAVPGSKPTLTHGGKGMVRFGGPLDLSDRVLFIIDVRGGGYWRTQTYDTYTSAGWLTGPGIDDTLKQGVASVDSSGQSFSRELSYSVVPQVYTDIMLTTGDIVSSSTPVMIRRLSPTVFTIRLSDSTADSSLPADIAALARELRKEIASQPLMDSKLAETLAPGLNLVSTTRSGERIRELRVSRAGTESDDIIAMSSIRAMEPNKKYRISAQVNWPSQNELAKAGEDYPRFITDRYLQLPSSLPQRVRDLAKSITAGAQTAHAKALAIREYLSHMPYTLTIEAPPRDTDGVDYFLFKQRAGYCVYFASAMSAMLRSVGVPARLCTGYLGGSWDSRWQGYVITERDFHAWPEIYFPGYGWVEMEATPGRGSSSVFNEPNDTGRSDAYGPDEFLSYEDEILEEDIFMGAGPGGTPPTPGRRPLWIIPVITAFLAILAVVWYRRFARLDGKNSAGVAYSRMCLLAALARLGPQTEQTVLEYSARLSTVLTSQAPSIDHIARAYSAVQYSPNKAIGPLERWQLQYHWQQVRSGLVKRIFRLEKP